MGMRTDRARFWRGVILLVSCRLIAASSFTQSTTNSLEQGNGESTLPVVIPITEAPPTRCYFYDSADGRNRTCPIRTSGGACFSYIRRRTDGTFRLRRGCSADCMAESRNKKIQVCCTEHLCNTHTLTSDNFTSLAATTPQTVPAFTATARMATRSATVSAAPSVTIRPPKLIPEENSSEDDDVVTPGRPSVFYTCNCNQCGQEATCVGAQCIVTFAISHSGSIDYKNYYCSNSTSCADGTICCNDDYCNAEVVRSSQPPSMMSSSAPGTGFNPDKITTGGTTSPSDLSAINPVTGTADQYFTIATAISVVGGVTVICTILLILLCIVVHHRRKTTRTKLLRRPSPPSMASQNRSIMKPSPSPSFSLTSTESSSDSSTNSNSILSVSRGVDNPLKYLGTSV